MAIQNVRGIRDTLAGGTILGRPPGSAGPAQVLTFKQLGEHLTKTGAVSGGGSSTLAGLSDVSISGLVAGQFLKWNGTKWVNASGGGGSISIVQNGAADGASITGVILGAAPTNGNILIAFVGGVNVTAPGPGWGIFAPVDGGGATFTTILWKLAGAGESTTQNPLSTAASCGIAMYEISGAGAGGQTFHDVTSATTNTINPITLSTSAIIIGFAYNEGSTALPAFTGATADASSSTTHGVQGWRVAAPVAGSNSITATYGAAVNNRLAAVVVH